MCIVIHQAQRIGRNSQSEQAGASEIKRGEGVYCDATQQGAEQEGKIVSLRATLGASLSIYRRK